LMSDMIFVLLLQIYSQGKAWSEKGGYVTKK
jgi:hypothetical protein